MTMCPFFITGKEYFLNDLELLGILEARPWVETHTVAEGNKGHALVPAGWQGGRHLGRPWAQGEFCLSGKHGGRGMDEAASQGPFPGVSFLAQFKSVSSLLSLKLYTPIRLVWSGKKLWKGLYFECRSQAPHKALGAHSTGHRGLTVGRDLGRLRHPALSWSKRGTGSSGQQGAVSQLLPQFTLILPLSGHTEERAWLVTLIYS